ncbi:MAG: class I adenylate-forming enzyme family protein [Mycobacterium sp.]
MTQDGVPFGQQIALRALADADGTGVTVVHSDGTETSLTWNALETDANEWAHHLAMRQVGLGTTVALCLPNSTDLVLAALACWKLGAVPIPMRWDLPEWENQRLLEVINPVLVVTSSTAYGVHPADVHARLPSEYVVSPAINGVCSSGSTGLPKVILNARPALWTPAHSVPFMENWRPVQRPQRILVPGPMYHTNGFNALLYLLAGDSLAILETFDAALALDAIERYRITTFTATPTMLARIADFPGAKLRDLSSIDWILQGAAVMPPSLLRRWFDLLSPDRIVMAYGMTENLGLTALRGDEWLEHPGSVGRGFRDTEVRILDPDGKPLPPMKTGEIYLRAPMSNSYQYLGGASPLPTTSDGFGSAGDLGHLDHQGYLYIADRRTDMIVTGGANVFPAEIESALVEHDDIADVVVIGLSDTRWGRRIHAVVQLTDPGRPLSAEAVIRYAKEKLAAYKVPKTVEFVEHLPRSAATKISRSAMTRVREEQAASQS